MKKVLSVLAASAFVLTAGVALAGGPGKKMADDSCPEPCQQQIDDLQSSQAQQNEQLGAHGTQLQNHEGRISTLEKAWDDYWYFRLGAGASWLSADGDFSDQGLDFDSGWTGRIAAGREFSMFNASGKFRAELEFAYQTNDANLDNPTTLIGDFLQQNGRDISADIYTFMVNGYYEQPVADAFSVYVMAGMGMGHIAVDGQIWEGAGWVDIDEFVDGRNSFAYKAGVGVTYNFTDQIAGDLGYEYLGIADTGALSDINTSSVIGSVRFKF